MRKMNKEKFLKTEIGSSMEECITAWDKWLEVGDRKAAYWCQAQWEVYKMAVKQFYASNIISAALMNILESVLRMNQTGCSR